MLLLKNACCHSLFYEIKWYHVDLCASWLQSNRRLIPIYAPFSINPPVFQVDLKSHEAGLVAVPYPLLPRIFLSRPNADRKSGGAWTRRRQANEITGFRSWSWWLYIKREKNLVSYCWGQFWNQDSGLWPPLHQESVTLYFQVKGTGVNMDTLFKKKTNKKKSHFSCSICRIGLPGPAFAPHVYAALAGSLRFLTGIILWSFTIRPLSKGR